MDHIAMKHLLLAVGVAVVTWKAGESVSQPDDKEVVQRYRCLVECQLAISREWMELLGAALSSSGNAPSALPLDIQSILRNAQGMSAEDRKGLFIKLCETYDKFRECARTCPGGLGSLGAVKEPKALGALKMVCGPKRQDYLESMPCLSGKIMEMEKECQAEQVHFQSAAWLLKSQIPTPSRLKAYLDNFCGAYKNKSDCMLPAVRRECGEKAASLVGTLQFEGFQTARNALLSLSAFSLPSSCIALFDKPSDGGSHGGGDGSVSTAWPEQIEAPTRSPNFWDSLPKVTLPSPAATPTPPPPAVSSLEAPPTFNNREAASKFEFLRSSARSIRCGSRVTERIPVLVCMFALFSVFLPLLYILHV